MKNLTVVFESTKPQKFGSGDLYWCKNHQDFQFKLRDLTKRGYKEIL